MKPPIRRTSSAARPAAIAMLLVGLAGCGGEAPLVPPPPVPSPSPTPTPLPVIGCGVTLSAAIFDPFEIRCPLGQSRQVRQAYFDASVNSGTDVRIDAVEDRISETSRSPWDFGPGVMTASRTTRIKISLQFDCINNAPSDPLRPVSVRPLFVVTSCGTGVLPWGNTLYIGPR